MIKKILTYTVLSLFLASCSAAVSPPEDSVRQAVEKFSQAFKNADAEALSAMLTDDYLHCNNGSEPIGKATWLEFVRSRKIALDAGSLKLREYRNEDVRVVCYGNSAVVSGVNIAEGLRDSQSFSTKIRFTHLWVLEDRVWKRAAFHDSPLPVQPRAPGKDLEVTFIGNEAFEITDGSVTLLSDFPYQSGAFGYMTYDMAAVKPRGKVLCLVTHEHDDHFSPGLWAERDWHLLASPRIKTIGNHKLRLNFADTVDFEGIRIFSQKTPHTTAHYSYLVEWHGKRLYFPGDTELLDFFPKKRIDVLFITPWLLEKAQKQKVQLNAKRVVVYHHQNGDSVDCSGCIVPKQGDKFLLD